MGDRVRGVSHDGGGGELHPHRGHRGRGREQRPAHQQSRLPHSSQGPYTYNLCSAVELYFCLFSLTRKCLSEQNP